MKNDEISAAEENDLSEDEMKSEEGRGQSEESEESGQSMERPKISIDGTDVGRLEMNFDVKAMYLENTVNC